MDTGILTLILILSMDMDMVMQGTDMVIMASTDLDITEDMLSVMDHMLDIMASTDLDITE